jgi:hypothetical protein
VLKFEQGRKALFFKEGDMATETLNSLSCPVCKFPIKVDDDISESQQIRCPSCGVISETIRQITIPTGVFTFGLGVLIGVIFGPALIASTETGAEWLAKKARERLAGS